jgi:hypothetical protein
VIGLVSDHARWTLIASAIAGRPTPLTPTESALAYSDGVGIFVPSDCPVHTIMVQGAMIVAGSFTAPGLRLLAGRRGSADRYLSLEARRAVHALGEILPTALVERAATLHEGPVSESSAESLKRARSTRIPGAPPWCGTIRPLKLSWNGGPSAAEVSDLDLRESGSASDTLQELDGDDDAADRSRILELLAAPLANPLATKLAQMLGMGTTPGDSDDGGQEFNIGGSRPGTGSGGKRRTSEHTQPTSAGRPGESSGWRYDEWSHRTGSYKRRWCTVAELLPDTSAAADPFLAPTDFPLRQQLARLGLTDARHRRQPDGDALDITALTDYAVERRAGSADGQRVHEARRRTHRDLGVLVLLDASGSTGSQAGNSEVFEAQRELAGRLTATLDELGDRVATYAFYSRGRDNVRFLRVKDFHRRYDRAAQLRLAALAPSGYTRLGAAVRHATHVLATHAGTASTLLVVIGDGLPYDEGYERHYAQQDTRRALTEAVQRGVGCACISLRSATRPDVIDAVWGHVAQRALERPQDLARHVRPMFRQALAEAAASKRADTRTALPAAAQTDSPCPPSKGEQ